MQTNREDVGSRYRQIRVPVAPNGEAADKVSAPFRDYYTGMQDLREKLLSYLSESDKFHIFLSSAEAVEENEEEYGEIE